MLAFQEAGRGATKSPRARSRAPRAEATWHPLVEDWRTKTAAVRTCFRFSIFCRSVSLN